MFVSRGSAISALAIVFLGVCIASTNGRAPSRIIGGTDARPGEFPYQVSIRAYDTHLCGGTIISKRHILTAAHCIFGVSEAPYSEMTVVTGSYTMKPGTGKAYRVKDVVIHKQYAPKTKRTAVKNDIAVISLRKEMEENEFQKPIPLATGNVPNGVQGIVTGFGRIDYEQRKQTDVLQKQSVILMSSGDCFERGVRIQNSQLCGFKGVGYGTCKGDSGGPLAYNGELVGIASTSIIPCGLGIPDTYTRVSYYLDFIKKAMATI